MKKIEPVAFYFKTEYSCGLEWTKIGKSTNPLYTSEALETVAHSAVLATFEAIRDSGNYPASADMPDIDIAAIINQLTGE